MFNLFSKKSEPKPLPPKEIYPQYPSGIRCTLLRYYENKAKGADYIRDVIPYSKEADRIDSVFVKRNIKGEEFEKQGQIEKAIKLYEQNITDFTDTPFPYERLRILYTKQKKYAEAIRACQMYIDMSKALEAAVLKELNNPTLAKQLGEISDYPEKIEKLKKKLNE